MAVTSVTLHSTVKAWQGQTLKIRVLHYNKMEKLASAKHYTLLGPLVGYKKNKVNWIQREDSTNTKDKHSSLLGQFVSYEKREYDTWAQCYKTLYVHQLQLVVIS